MSGEFNKLIKVLGGKDYVREAEWLVYWSIAAILAAAGCFAWWLL